MRLIDADAFFNEFSEIRDYEFASQEYEVDAVPIVRCKECKHRNRYECDRIRLGETKCGVTDDWFCADGERKEE